jgi:hypothetical protein
MKRMLFLLLLIGFMAFQVTQANPLPPYEIVYIKAFPPQIGLSLYGPTDISGYTITTLSGVAIVDSGIIAEGYLYDPFILDSSNTSGFALNPEGDTVGINLPWLESIKWGTLGEASAPIKGYSLTQKLYNSDPPYGMGVPRMVFDFTNPRQGFTDVVINEVNAHCDWRPNSNFIELYNKGASAIDIGDWMVICDTVYRIPAGVMIPSHGYYVIDEGAFPAAFDMDFDADNIYLINSDSEIVDQVGWSSDHAADISFMRMPDGNADDFPYKQGYWGYDDESSIAFEEGFPSRQATNRYYPPGLKIIGIQSDTAYLTANISWTNPIWLSVFTDAIVRRSTDDFPQTPYDGDIIYEGPGQWCSDRDITPGNTYFYTIYARTSCGDYSEPDSESQIAVTFPAVGVDTDPIPQKAALFECYPNPFNASTLIRYRLSEPGLARLSIYNLAGQRVAVLQDGDRQGGEHSVIWDGEGFASGIYFARLESGIYRESIRLVMVK